MKKFKLNGSVSVAYIPGAGKVTEGQELMGEEFGKYAPRLLMEVPETPVSAAPMLVEPAPSPVPAAPPAPSPAQVESVRPLNEVMGDAAPAEETPVVEEKRKPGRPKGSGKNGG